MGYNAFTDSYHSPSYAYGTTTATTYIGGSPSPPSAGFPISIDGRNYMIDTSFEPYRREAFRHKSLQAQRQSLHFTNLPDDGTISTEGLWRREGRDWSLGSGQSYFDRKDSKDNRFFHSKGINPWTQWLTTLQNDVQQQYPQATTINATGLTGASTTVTVVSTASFPSSGTFQVQGSGGLLSFAYTGITSTTFTGCTLVSGTSTWTIANGGIVTNASNTNNIKAIRVGQTVFIADGNKISYLNNWSNNPTPITTSGVSGYVPSTVLDICTNGYYLFFVTKYGVFQYIPATNVLSAIVASSDTSGTGFSHPWVASDGTFPFSALLNYVGERLILVLNNVGKWNTNVPSDNTGCNVFDLSYHLTTATNLTATPPSTTTPTGSGSITTAQSTVTVASLVGFSATGGTAKIGSTNFTYTGTYTDTASGSSAFQLIGCSVSTGTLAYTTASSIVSTTYVFAGQTNYVVGQTVDLNVPGWTGWTPLTGQVVTSVAVDTSTGAPTPQFTITNAGTAPTTIGYGATAIVTSGIGTPLAYSQGNEWFYTNPNPRWIMTAISAGNGEIYLAGHVVDTSGSSATASGPGIVFRSSITGTSSNNNPTAQYLSYPVSALPMPVGEYPTSLYCYLNYIFIGSNKGIRMASTINAYDPTGNAGDLKAGPLIPAITETPSAPITAITGDDRYIYWSWNNFDADSSGVGRLDLTTFIDVLAPAYASDLMIFGQGTVSWLDWDAITDSPLISLSNFTKMSDQLVASLGVYGTIDGSGMTTTSTSFVLNTIASSPALPATPFYINVDTEIMQVTAISGVNLTVTRAQKGTTATAHSITTDVTTITPVFSGYNNFVVGDVVSLTNFSNGAYNFSNVTITQANSAYFTTSGTIAFSGAVPSGSGSVLSKLANGDIAAPTATIAFVATGGIAQAANRSYVFTANPNSTVASGYIDEGIITYGIPDIKNAVIMDLNVENVAGQYGSSSINFQMSPDGQDYVDLGTYSNTIRKAKLDGFPQQYGEQYALITTLNAAQTDNEWTNVSPILNRWTLKALPGIPSGIMISAVLNLFEPFEIEGSMVYQDPYVEYAALEALRQAQSIVTYVEGPFTAQVTIEMIDWLPERRRRTEIGGYHGDLVCYMKTISG